MSQTEMARRRFIFTRGQYTAIAGVALGALCLIVLTGAMVRLTGSGLGCEDWPRCNESKFIDVSSGHTAIEQLNRLFTGVVSFAVIAAVLAAYRRQDRDATLVKWAWTLVIGVLAQIVLGGVVVLTGLNPFANMGHFLLSMVLVTCAFVVWRVSQQVDARPLWRWAEIDNQAVRRWFLAFLALATVVMIAGTVVTATGPHAGDENAVRFGFELRTVARLHGGLVIAMLATSLVLYRHVLRQRIDALMEPMRTFYVIAVAQAGIGYAQYFTGVPVFLVSLHIAGATAFWLSICNLSVARRAT